MQKFKILFLLVTIFTIPLFGQWGNFSSKPNRASCCNWNSGCCFDGNFTVGVDFLYWTACVGDNHFGVERDATVTNLKYKYFDCEWDPGYRVFLGVDNIFGCLNLQFVYTYFDTEVSDSFSSENGSTFSASLPSPISFAASGSSISADWNLNYQHFELTLGYPLAFGRTNCFSLVPFSGLQVLLLDQKRHELTLFSPSTSFLENHRKTDFWGVGSMLGASYSYKFFNCLSWNGSLQGQILLGEVEAEDHFDVGNGTLFRRTFKDHDDCFCFSGWHFRTGLDYTLAVCGTDLDFRIGYEYLQWIEAPTFIFYSPANFGIISSFKRKTLTLYGLFAGLSATF